MWAVWPQGLGATGNNAETLPPRHFKEKRQGFRPEPASAHPEAPPTTLAKQAQPGRCSGCPTRTRVGTGTQAPGRRSQVPLCWEGGPTTLWFLSAPDLDVQVSLLGSQHHFQATEAARVVTFNSDLSCVFHPLKGPVKAPASWPCRGRGVVRTRAPAIKIRAVTFRPSLFAGRSPGAQRGGWGAGCPSRPGRAPSQGPSARLALHLPRGQQPLKKKQGNRTGPPLSPLVWGAMPVVLGARFPLMKGLWESGHGPGLLHPPLGPSAQMSTHLGPVVGGRAPQGPQVPVGWADMQEPLRDKCE